MKKVLVLSVLMVFALSGVVFAAELGINTASEEGLQIFGGIDATQAAGNSSVLLGKMSKGVAFKHNSDADGFAAATKHGSGTKSYGTASDSTAIYFNEVGQTGAIPNLSDANNDSFASAGWTNM